MIAFQLYVPYWLYERAGLNPEAEGLNVHGLIHRPLQTTALLSDLKRVMVLVLFTFPPFAIGHHFFQVHIGGHTQGYTFQLPPDLLLFVIFQVLLVALPEELFYRGFMLVSLEKYGPIKRFFWGFRWVVPSLSAASFLLWRILWVNTISYDWVPFFQPSYFPT